LIHEAKRDLYEKLVQKQAEQDKKNQERAARMYEWEEKKLVQEALQREQQFREKEKERLKKQVKKE
jgi:hypothetical protein